MKHIPRFFRDNEIVSSREISLSSEQMFHASKVLRLTEGDIVRVFNSSFGEWNCEIKNIKKNIVSPINLIREPREEIGPSVACAIIHPNKFALMIEKLTELGVQEIYPVITEFTQHKGFNEQKMQQIITHACEQSRRLTIPKIYEITRIPDLIGQVFSNRKILVGVENEHATKLINCLDRDAAFLVGPEGGFSEREIAMFNVSTNVRSFYLGRNILRSETAAIAFCSTWVANFL